MLPFPCLSALVFTARQKTILVPSGYMSEFPRRWPISILLGCDTQPDVAAPLTSGVSLLTGCLDSSSQGQERVWCWSTGGTPMMFTESTPLLLSEQLLYSTNKDSMPCQSWRVSFGIYCVLLGFRAAPLWSKMFS